MTLRYEGDPLVVHETIALRYPYEGHHVDGKVRVSTTSPSPRTVVT